MRLRKVFDNYDLANRGITLVRHEGGRFAKLALLFVKELDREAVMRARPHAYAVQLPGSVVGSAPRPLWNSIHYDASQVGHFRDAAAAATAASAGSDDPASADPPFVLTPRRLPKPIHQSAYGGLELHTPFLDAAVAEEPTLATAGLPAGRISTARRKSQLRHSHHIVIREKYGASDHPSDDEVPMYVNQFLVFHRESARER